jgi:hypothetical protein
MEIQNYEAGCAALNLNAEDELPYKGNNLTTRQKRTNAFAKISIINEAMHLDVKGDKDYLPIFDTDDDTKEAGFGFLDTDCAGWNALTTVGARLQFATREMAHYSGINHEPIYRALLAENI